MTQRVSRACEIRCFDASDPVFQSASTFAIPRTSRTTISLLEKQAFRYGNIATPKFAVHCCSLTGHKLTNGVGGIKDVVCIGHNARCAMVPDNDNRLLLPIVRYWFTQRGKKVCKVFAHREAYDIVWEHFARGCGKIAPYEAFPTRIGSPLGNDYLEIALI